MKIPEGMSSLECCTSRWRRAVAALALAAGLSAATVPAMGEGTGLVPGIIAVIDRTEIEMSGMASLGDLLSNRSTFNVYGISGLSSGRGVEYTLDGRRQFGLDLHALPLAAVERIEIMEESGARFPRHNSGVIVNVLLKSGLEGTEVLGAMGRPVLKGADINHGSGVWGGKLGSGRVLIAVDRNSVQEVPDAARDFSRARWVPGGSFADTQGVSVFGNTIYVDGVGARALGTCDTGTYAGVLRNPRGVDGEGCGYAFADIAWLDERDRNTRDSVLLRTEHPFGDNAEVYLHVLASRTDSHRRYAPNAGNFEFVPTGTVRDRIIAATDGLSAGDLPPGTEVSVDHRFLGHGNRDWLTVSHSKLLTLGVHGELADGVEYDIRAGISRDRSRLDAGTFVSESLIREAVESGAYDITDPLSPDPGHLEAIRRTSVRHLNDTVSDYSVLQAELAGKAFRLPGGPSDWTVAVDIVDIDWRSSNDYPDSTGVSRDVTDVIGAGGISVAGKRTTSILHAAANLPVHPDLDLMLFGALGDRSDVGGTSSWQVAGRYRPFDMLTLRAQLGRAEIAPGLLDLNSPTYLDYPYICDTREAECSNQQVERERGGNPQLKPSETEFVKVGIEVRAGRHSFGIDVHESESTGLPTDVSPQYLVDLDVSGSALPPGAAVIRDGTGRIDRIVSPLLNSGEFDGQGVAVRAGTGWETNLADMQFDVRVHRQTKSEFRVAGAIQPGDFPRNRAHATLKASRKDLTASWNAYHVSGFWNVARTGRYSSWTGHDLALHWQDAFDVDGLAVAGGILNVGNNGPALNPATPNNPSITTDSLRGRTFFLRTGMSF